jgi:uncharacterized peroxidase-related enzyme
MPRIQTIDPAKTEGNVKQTLDALHAKLGTIPNIFKTIAQAPAVLDFYMAGSGALGKSSLSAALREQLALTVAGANACDYCASAHTAIGRKVGVAEDELPKNLKALSADSKIQAALTFAKKVTDSKAHIADADLKAVRDAGYNDAQIMEIIAVVAFNIFTNYINHVVDTEVDFPKVETQKMAA